MGLIVRAVLVTRPGIMRCDSFLKTVASFFLYFATIAIVVAVLNSVLMTMWSKFLSLSLIAFPTLKASRKSSMSEQC